MYFIFFRLILVFFFNVFVLFVYYSIWNLVGFSKCVLSWIVFYVKVLGNEDKGVVGQYWCMSGLIGWLVWLEDRGGFWNEVRVGGVGFGCQVEGFGGFGIFFVGSGESWKVGEQECFEVSVFRWIGGRYLRFCFRGFWGFWIGFCGS